jgi:hypothetical protein
MDGRTSTRDTRVSLRVDRTGDGPRLHELAALDGRRLPDCGFVVAEVDGRIVAALPLDGDAPLADPFVETAHLVPLLEVRAMHLRRADRSRRPAPRLVPLPA